MIANIPPSVGEVKVGSLFVDAYFQKELVVIFYVSPSSYSVRVLNADGSTKLWDFDAFRFCFRRVM